MWNYFTKIKSFIWALFFVVVVFVVVSPPVFAQTDQEHISLFESDITINQDGSLQVDERIEYYTPYSKHGIYRYIPYRYHKDGLITTAPIKDIKVTDELGQEMKVEVFDEEGNKTLKIGDPDKTFTGQKTYLISYVVKDALVLNQEEENVPSLIWDITGEGWNFPILETIARVHSPYATIVSKECFAGLYGIDEGTCQVISTDANAIEITNQEQISYGQNITVDICLSEDNRLLLPTSQQLLIKKIRDNWSVLVTPIPFIVMLLWWYFLGRDYVYYTEPLTFDENKPYRLQPVFNKVRTPFVYIPFENITPGQAGVLLDEKVNNQDVIAELLDLARKRYIKIEGVFSSERQKKKGKAKDYIFHRLKDTVGELPDHQKYLFESIFGGKEMVKLSSLKGSFHTHFSKTTRKIYQSAVEQKWFSSNPAFKRSFGLAVSGILVIVSAIPLIFFVSFTANIIPLVIFVILSVFAVFFGYQLPQKTAQGSALMARVRGLKKTIQYGKWRQEIQEKRLFIDEVLPFAVATGVVNKLAKDMKDLNIPQPDYVTGFAPGSISTFSHSISSFNSSTASGMSYSPSSSSSSGGSFSGGGGGGGGGGSW